MIYDRLMRLGSWDLTLDNVPTDVLASLAWFGRVMVIDGPAADIDGRTVADVATMASWAGVLRSRRINPDTPATVQLSGSGQAFWIGDEDDKGPVWTSPHAVTGLSFQATITGMLAAGVQGLYVSAGTITDIPGPGLFTGTFENQSWRESLDYVVDLYDGYWRINPDMTLDAGPASAMFTTTPDAIIVRRASMQGSDMDLDAYRGRLRTDDSAVDYTSRVLLLGEADGATVASALTEAGTFPYTAPDGTAYKATRIVTEATTDTTNATARAQLQLNRFTNRRKALQLSTESHDIAGTIRPGDTVWIHDPDAGLIDTSQQVTFQGRLVTPVAIQVVGVQRPVTDATTVVYVAGDGTVIDLTRFVRPENRPTRVDVGAYPRTLTTPTGATAAGRVTDATNAGGDTIAPAQVTLVTPFLAGAELSNDGVTTAYIITGWLQPTNTDATVITDGAWYEIAWRPAGAPHWSTTTIGWGTTNAELHGLTPGATYDVRVRAVDQSGNQGAWSATETLLASGDTIAPSTPAAATVAGNPLAIQVTHDLTKATGGSLELDVALLEVHLGTTAGFATSPATKIGEIPVVAGTITLGLSVIASFATFTDATRYVKVIAVDRSGNASGASAAATVAATLIDTANITDAAITNLKVADVSASKLTAGTITAAAVTIGAGGTIQSSNFVTGPGGSGYLLTDTLAELNDVTVRGTLDAATGTFAGSLSAATGTFAGSLSAATGTFAGSLSAATGTFAGTVSAGAVIAADVSGDRITGGTIEGVTYRSGPTTAGRIEITNTHEVNFYKTGFSIAQQQIKYDPATNKLRIGSFAFAGGVRLESDGIEIVSGAFGDVSIEAQSGSVVAQATAEHKQLIGGATKYRMQDDRLAIFPKSTGIGWANMPLLVQDENTSAPIAGLSMHNVAKGLAQIFRASNVSQKLMARNWADSAWIPLEASSFNIGSRPEIKREMRRADLGALAALKSKEFKRFRRVEDAEPRVAFDPETATEAEVRERRFTEATPKEWAHLKAQMFGPEFMELGVDITEWTDVPEVVTYEANDDGVMEPIALNLASYATLIGMAVQELAERVDEIAKEMETSK